MPRFLAVGHVTRDSRPGGDVLGGSAAYGALTAARLGWEVGLLTAAGPDFEPEREMPGISVFVRPSVATTRFVNTYDEDGTRRQVVTSRADDIDLESLPDDWREPDALLLGTVAGELAGISTASLGGQAVGAVAQGWLRQIGPGGEVSPREWSDASRDLLGVHVVFLSEQDLPNADAWAREKLAQVPMVALTRGWQGLTLLTRDGAYDVPSLPREEVDPTGAGDVFSAACLVRYHESGDPLEAAAFAACAASCAVEGVGTSTLGDREEVLERMRQRERLIEEGEWDE
jgi:sugar/nucleoside kinase (ribokinase family)